MMMIMLVIAVTLEVHTHTHTQSETDWIEVKPSPLHSDFLPRIYIYSVYGLNMQQ